MRTKRVAPIAVALILIVLASHAQETQTGPQHATPGAGRVNPTYGNVPLIFEANQGQTSGQVKFLSRGSGYSVFLTAGGMVLALQSPAIASRPDASSVPNGIGSGLWPIRQQERLLQQQKSAAIAIDLVGAASNPIIVGEEALTTKINYFIGRDPAKWRRNVPTYGKIRYRSVYPGIDLVYYGNNHRVEYDFDLAPGADPSQIQFSVSGADALELDSSGNLVLTKGGTTLNFQTPSIYQESNGVRSAVAGTYKLLDATHVGFAIQPHDSTKPLVIDPVLNYSTFLGGSSDDFSNAIAVDSAGDAYVVGITDSPDFPLATIGPYNPSQFRMYLTKLNPTGTALIFADYFGGTSGSDGAYSVATDSSGSAYVTGVAASADFPVVNPYQSTLSGSYDAFLVKFSADGSSIIYSTYLGGSNSQIGNSVSVDLAGEAVVAGITQSTDFPMVNAYQSSVSTDQFGDWGVYGFLTKFTAPGNTLAYSTYLAGSTLNTSTCSGCFPMSDILAVTTDASGNAYMTGFTTTTDFPVTSGAYITTFPGAYLNNVGFVSKFTTAGAIAYSTYLGGATSSFFDAIAVDATGSAYVTGWDVADDAFPVITTAMCDPSVSDCNGAIVAKLDPTASSLAYSTYLPLTNEMAGQGIQVDASGDAFIVGSDYQAALSNPIEQYAGNYDIVVAEIDPGANTQVLATFLGGQGAEAAAGLALDSNGAVYVTGITQSLDFPVTQSAFQTGFGGQTDAFVTKIDPSTNASAVAMGPFSLQFGSQVLGITSAPQTSILRNMGSAPLTISSKTMSGDFAETDDCGAVIAAASLCTFNITFTPTAVGVRTGTLTISDDAQDSPHSVNLAGTGTGAFQSVTISPSSLTFPSSPVGTESAAQVVTFSNNGSTTVTVGGIQVTANFKAASNNCGTVAPSASCTVQISFVPSSAGLATGTLTFLDSVNGSSQIVALSGSGTDFVTTTTDSTATVQPGGTASYTLSITPTGGGFGNTVTFSCAGAPAFATCAVNPQSVVPNNNSVTTTVTVATSGPAAQLHKNPHSERFLASIFSAQFAIFGVLLLGAGNRRRFRHYIAAELIVMLLLLAGCGGASTAGKQSPVVSSTTPSGTYSLTVIATSGKTQHATKLSLIVQ